ncbi:MAG: AMP-binding protein [Candidatus Nanopelagicales bacterium]
MTYVNALNSDQSDTYEQLYRESLDDPESFWLRAAEAIDWDVDPAVALDPIAGPGAHWFPGGSLNTCYNALDRHVEAGRGDQAALIYDSPVTGTVATYTYEELLGEVARFAGVLAGLGVEKGDRVLIYMPMIPEAVIAMLATARLGAIHSVVFGGFAADELAARIDDAEPKVIVSASCGIERTKPIAYKPLLDQAIETAEHTPGAQVIKQRPQLVAELGPLDVDWDEQMAAASPIESVPVKSDDPLYILYTSGTTGKPKGVVRDNGGHAVAVLWSMTNIFDIGPGDVFWAASDVGWVVGHSYIVYGPLLAGATTVLFEGKPVGTPDAGAFGRVIADHGVKALFTAPTAIRAIRKEDHYANLLRSHDISSLEALYFAGERLDPDTYEWATELLAVPVIDNWWQTETGWPIAANPRGIELLPIRSGSPAVAMPGYRIEVVDGEGAPLGRSVEGNIAIKLPLPPGNLQTIWGDDDRFVSGYLQVFDGYYATGDGGFVDDDGYVHVMGRTDDVINVAGHRLSTGSMEAVVAEHPDVAECAVIGVHDALKGQVPRALIVLQADAQASPDQIAAAVVASVREHIGPVAALKSVVCVPALPKTRSGKILRRSMRAIAEGREEPVPSTIEDPKVLETITPYLLGD